MCMCGSSCNSPLFCFIIEENYVEIVNPDLKETESRDLWCCKVYYYLPIVETVRSVLFGESSFNQIRRSFLLLTSLCHEICKNSWKKLHFDHSCGRVSLSQPQWNFASSRNPRICIKRTGAESNYEYALETRVTPNCRANSWGNRGGLYPNCWANSTRNKGISPQLSGKQLGKQRGTLPQLSG